MTVLQIFAFGLIALFWLCGFIALLGFIDEMIDRYFIFERGEQR